ncbi:MAG: FAD-dependent oxidoreductase [Thermodesulfobacteriota bacterium]|jgi:fumarate reductase flavoprotein subunit
MKHLERIEEAEIVVVGSGVCGLSAALTAAEGGARVTLLEKQRSLGGSSNFFEGTFAVESDIQRNKYITYSRDEAFRNFMEYSHWRADPRVVRAFVDESAATIAWLQQHGVEFIDAIVLMPDSPRTYHVVKGTGEALVKSLASSAKEKGVELDLGAAATKILKENGRITGVVVDRDGVETTIHCKVVVIASGGYANNETWIKKYTGFDLDVNMIPIGNVGKMGDGIRMAWEVGAAEEGMGVLEMYRIGPMGPEFPMKSHLQVVGVQPDLWVNHLGERFCDEGVSFYDTSAGNVSAFYKAGYTFTLLDESIKQLMMERGVDRNMAQENPPGTRPVNFDKELNAALQSGSTEVCAADSIEELAERMGVEPAILAATVAEYNGFCDKGHDDLFAKDPKYLRPLKTPKFYAIKCRTVFLGTLGGIKISHRMEVLDSKGKVIPGLYAGGMDAGGMWGDSYPIREGNGASSAFAINSGRIAGKNLLQYLCIEGGKV